MIGGGIAGQSVCEAVRERDPEVPITLLSSEAHFPYDRVNLSELLAPDAPSQGLGRLQLRPEEWYADHRVRLELGCEVRELDLGRARVRVRDGRGFTFDRLVVATGSQPLLPPLAGIDLDGVHPRRGRRAGRRPPGRPAPSSSAAGCSASRRPAGSRPRAAR